MSSRAVDGVDGGIAWNSQALLNDPASYIPEAKRSIIEKAALAACGTQQKVADPLLRIPSRASLIPQRYCVKRRIRMIASPRPGNGPPEDLFRRGEQYR